MADICLVNGAFPPDEFGGAENYVHRVAVALQERGHDVSILTTTSERSRKSLTPIKELYKGVPVYRFYPLNHSHRSDGTGENVLAKALWHQLDTVNPHAKRVVSKFLEKHQPDVSTPIISWGSLRQRAKLSPSLTLDMFIPSMTTASSVRRAIY
ncbi:glycosyltransferase [Haloferax volcanii]|uniref:Glycosyltransferase n=1 Tax=Haloferax volcanii TaxID=2246 RepID=A0A558FNK6_HALVO|nr:glycosyltransferase [Haloferax volcanii]TVT87094.1 glycosyltransferase [Haloferax volcanii]